jgi:hypothetical protein
MTKNIKVPDEVFHAVRGLLDERQVVELGKFWISVFGKIGGLGMFC